MVFLIIGTVLSLVYIAFLIVGRKYDYMVAELPDETFPFKSLYVAGIAMQRLIPPGGAFATKLKDYSVIYYGKKYGDFYACISWAQALSLGPLFFTVCLLLGTIIPDLKWMLLLIGAVFAGYTIYYFLNYIKTKIEERREECEYEFPNAISKLALLVNAGVIMRDAWKMTAYGKEGVIYELMRRACEQMDNGVSDAVAIHDFSVSVNSSDVKKFTAALIQSMERGGGEISTFLTNQSTELWNHRRQLALQRGEKAAGALLAPIALMFVGIMLIIMASALQSFSM